MDDNEIGLAYLELLHEIIPEYTDVIRRIPWEGIDQDPAHFMAALFVTKTVEHLRSLKALLDAGQYRDCSLIVRTMCEGYVILLWALSDSPNRPSRWKEYVFVEELRHWHRYSIHGVELSDTNQTKLMVGLQKYGKKYLKPVALAAMDAGSEMDWLNPQNYKRSWIPQDASNLREMALKTFGESSPIYEFVYRDNSSWIHWNVRGIGQAVKRENGIATYVPADLPTANYVLGTALTLSASLLEKVFPLFGMESSESLSRIQEQIVEIATAHSNRNKDCSE